MGSVSSRFPQDCRQGVRRPCRLRETTGIESKTVVALFRLHLLHAAFRGNPGEHSRVPIIDGFCVNFCYYQRSTPWRCKEAECCCWTGEGLQSQPAVAVISIRRNAVGKGALKGSQPDGRLSEKQRPCFEQTK